MKTIKEKFHRQIARNHKLSLFAEKRKQLLFVTQMKMRYNTIIQNNLDLMLIIQDYGYANFYKYCCQIVDNQLLTYILRSQSNLLNNLQFFQNIICLDLLSEISVFRFFYLISNILCICLQKKKLVKIIQNVKCLLKKPAYNKTSIECIKNQRTLDRIFDFIIQIQQSNIFYNLIELYKITSDFQCMNSKKLIHCIQVHILTCSDSGQLYQIYKFLGQIFDLLYGPQDQLSQYGSIICKMCSDMEIDVLIQPISLFLSKCTKNYSILKLLVQMNIVVRLSSFLINIYSNELNRKQNQPHYQMKASIFSQQSLWKLFKILIQQTLKMRLQIGQRIQIPEIDWIQIKKIIVHVLRFKQVYIKNEIFLFLESIYRIKGLKIYFQDIKIAKDDDDYSIDTNIEQELKQEIQFSFPRTFQYLSIKSQEYQI